MSDCKFAPFREDRLVSNQSSVRAYSVILMVTKL
jgi:hypothetical protein